MTRILVSSAPAGVAGPRTTSALFIHGVSSGPRCWERTLPRLGLAEPLVADLCDGPGRLARFPLANAVAELAGALAERSDGPITLVGHSMGGLIAIGLAVSHPAAVRRLVLVSTPALPVPGGLVGRGRSVLRATGRTDPSTFPMLAAGLWRMGPVRLWDALRQVLASDLHSELAAIEVPTLLVWGAHDTIVPAEIGERMAAIIPGAELVVIPDAGHMPMWERPDAFATAIGPFLAGAGTLS